MFRFACAELGLEPEEVTVVGDTMETDILGGVQMGCRTVLVLSGGTRSEHLPGYAFRPDEVLSSVAEFCTEAPILKATSA